MKIATLSGGAFAAVIFVTLAASPAQSGGRGGVSGQPLDCGDWVIVEPGISCRPLQICGTEATTGNVDFPCRGVAGSPVTVEGDILSHELVEPDSCGNFSLERLELKRSNGADERLVAYVNGRCCDAPFGCRHILTGGGVSFDGAHGRLLVYFRSECKNSPGCDYEPVDWLAAFEGFATTFEILDTYAPSTNTLGFRVPLRPEGFPAADSFDTYHGTLANPIDFTQAQPLQCGYPASQPSVGDYLTVEDPLPNPAPGQGRYYVTAVHHQGQIRFGRQAINGALSGRNPETLPACAP